jgi:hypothetical protein
MGLQVFPRSVLLALTIRCRIGADFQAEQLIEKAQLVAARQAKKEGLTLTPKIASAQADAPTARASDSVANAPVPVETVREPQSGAPGKTPSPNALSSAVTPATGKDASAPVSDAVREETASSATPASAKKPRNRKKKSDSALTEGEAVSETDAAVTGSVTDAPTGSPAKVNAAVSEAGAEAAATEAHIPSPAKKKRSGKKGEEETPVEAVTEASGGAAMEAGVRTPSPAKKSKAKGNGKGSSEAVVAAEKDETVGADEAATCSAAVSSDLAVEVSQEEKPGALSIAVDTLSPIAASSPAVASGALASLTVVAESPAAASDSFNPLSPLVEFHSLYPSLEDQIPAHDSVEEAEYPSSTPSARGAGHTVKSADQDSSLVEASPLVEFHTTYPDLQARTFREEMEEIEESSEGEEDEESAQSSYDLKNNTMDSTISAMSNQSTSSLSRVRDLNPLTRPSPGRNSFRLRLDMSTAVETEVPATETEPSAAVPLVQETAPAAAEEALEDEPSELPENALEARNAPGAEANATVEEEAGSGPVLMTADTAQDMEEEVPEPTEPAEVAPEVCDEAVQALAE